jgi:hypothetical protein
VWRIIAVGNNKLAGRRFQEDFAGGRKLNYLCALQVVVFGGWRGKGIRTYPVRAMKAIAEHICRNLDSANDLSDRLAAA